MLCASIVAIGLGLGMPQPTTSFLIESSHSQTELLLQVKGRITAVRPEKNEFVVSGNVKDWIFELARNGVVLIDGREGTLSDLRAGDDAVVTFERHGQQLLASAVRCTRKPNSSP